MSRRVSINHKTLKRRNSKTSIVLFFIFFNQEDIDLNDTLINEKIDDLENTVKVLRHDNDEYLFRIKKLEANINSLNAELNEMCNNRDSLITENDQLKNKLAGMQIRVSKVGNLEQALLEFHLEIKNRMNLDKEKISNDQPNRFKNIGFDPLILMEELRTNIRVLFSFKDDYENELKDILDKRKNKYELQIESLNVFYFYLLARFNKSW